MSVGLGRHCCCWATGLQPWGEGGNGSQVFTASMLTVLRHISLTVALAAGSARVTGLDASIYYIRTGVVFDGHIRCAQHGARFRLDSGDVTDHPAMDCLHSYEVCLLHVLTLLYHVGGQVFQINSWSSFIWIIISYR